MLRYRPSGLMDSGALATLLAASLGTGLGAGLVVHLVGQWIRLLILFPAGMGLVVGWVTAALVTRKAVRAPLLAAALAFLGGVTAWSTDLGISYLRETAELRTQVRDVASELSGPVEDARVEGALRAVLLRWGQGGEMSLGEIAAYLADEPIPLADGSVAQVPRATGLAGAVGGWLLYRAEMGTTLSRTGSSGGTRLGAAGTAVLWILELLLAGGLAAFTARAQASEPYCETCRRWYDPDQSVLVVGGTKDERSLRAALGGADAAAILALPVVEPPAKKFVVLRSRACPSCAEAPRFAQLVRVHASGRTEKERVLAAGLLDAGVWRALAEGLEARSPATEALPG